MPLVATPVLRRYFRLAFLIAWAITVPIALQVRGVVGKLLPAPFQWLIGVAPAIAAVIVTRRTPLGPWLAERCRRTKVGAVWWAIALLFPWALLGAAVLVRSAGGLVPAQLGWSASLLLFGVVWLVLAFGEEVGWRGLAIVGLAERWGFWTGSAILGVLWCVWHYPKLAANPYLHFDAAGIRLFALFSLQIVIANFILCWLARETGSVPIAATFHAGWNLVATVYSQAAIDPLLTGGLALIVVILVWRDRSRTAAIAKPVQL
jgi:membrane protease YdiL (CAAX protease family)